MASAYFSSVTSSPAVVTFWKMKNLSLGSAGRHAPPGSLAGRDGRPDVAQGGQPLHRVLVEVGRLRGRGSPLRPLDEPVQVGLHASDDIGVFGDKVRSLAGIAGDVEELGLRRVDVRVAGRSQEPEGAPAELDARGHGLRVGGDFGAGAGLADRRHERAALGFGASGDPGQLKHGREDVDRADLRGHSFRLETGQGRDDDERDVDGVVVDEIAVGALAVAAQALAVVTDEDDDRRLVEPGSLQPGEEAADLLVHEGHFAGVESGQAAAAVLGPEGFGRLVGRVGVVKVDPGEERGVLTGVEPGQGRVHDRVPRPLDGAEVDVLALAHVELVVVEFEALLEAPAPVDDEGRDERPTPVALGREDLGQGRLVLVQGRVAVDADPVIGGVHARQDGAMGGQGQRRGGGRLLEERAPGGQGV